MLFSTFESPIGTLVLTGDGETLCGIDLHGRLPARAARRDDAAFAAARAQLAAYFAGELTAFDLPLAPRGTPFQLRVWQALAAIPYAVTISYGDLARRISQPTAARAVGLANGANPLPIVVPCHRVIGADGSLTGFGGGLERKRWLLAHEAAHAARAIGAARRAA
jgi:methylated-DNA-[protein]-cysteine S-methyltransferase